MFYDFLEIEKYVPHKNTLNFEGLHIKYYTPDGLIKYVYNVGYNDLEVFFNERTGYLKIRGSFPFAFQGHNFNFKLSFFYEGIEEMESNLCIGLLDSYIKSFEFGAIIEVQEPIKQILQRHLSIKGFKKNEYSKGIVFEDKILKLKLYDAGYRIKTVSRIHLNNLQTNFGFNPKSNYVRIENHYKKPEIHFKARNIQLHTLFSRAFQVLCQDDLINNYQAIEKKIPYVLPNDKKLLTTATIPLLYLKELETQYGFEAEQGLLDFLNALSKESLPNNDRKQRRRQIRDNFNKLRIANTLQPEYDLLDKLQKSFY